MTYEHNTVALQERDAFDDAADQGNGIDGAWLRFSGKTGEWTLGDDVIRALRFCVIMPTIVVGEVFWQDQKIADKRIGRLADGFLQPRKITEGWSPYVALTGVGTDEWHTGELLTFSSTSWGGRNVVQGLFNPWRLKGRAEFPICEIGVAKDRDKNGNAVPLLQITGWKGRGGFPELLAPEAPHKAIAYSVAASHVPDKASQPLGEIIDDEIPF